jgi:hypothetical protein
MNNIPADIEIRIQCKDSQGETGTYMFDKLTGKQFGETYVDCVALFGSNDYRFAHSHNMIKQTGAI